MHGSPESVWNHSDLHLDEASLSLTPRRIRHVSSIQVRNLTPFPVRDAFASALKQPSEQPQFTSHGHLTDDLDVTIGRKHGRRFSTASSTTLSSVRIEAEVGQHETDHTTEFGVRKRTTSRASMSSGLSSPSSPSLGRRYSVTAAVPTVRPFHRPRTISVASSAARASFTSPAISGEPGTSKSASFSGLLRDTSQTGLEKVLQSRLVETFITIRLPTAPVAHALDGAHQGQADHHENFSSRSPTPSLKSSSSRERVACPTRKPDSAALRRNTVSASSSSLSPSKRSVTLSSSNLRNGASSSHSKASSVSFPNGRALKTPSSPPSQRQRSPIPPPLTSLLPKTEHSRLPGYALSSQEHAWPAPDYLSPIHRPSTNPYFQLDARSGFEFASSADVSGTRMHIEVWGRVGSGPGWSSAQTGTNDECSGRERRGKNKERVAESSPVKAHRGSTPLKPSDVKGKGREKEREGELSEWKVLEGWDFELDNLVPLPEDFVAHPSHLPSNTLLVTLSPPGQTFYLPAPSLNKGIPSPLPTSSTGYNSDPETDVRNIASAGGIITSDETARRLVEKMEQNILVIEEPSVFRRRREVPSAGWQDLLKVINLQTCISDTQESLSGIVRPINRLVLKGGAIYATREVSERTAWVAQLNEETRAVDTESDRARNRIAALREDLRSRRELLTLARQSHAQFTKEEAERELELAEEREWLSSLRSNLSPMRSILITTLANIFPIELVSPPDLLFTILDVPLPIPLAATDPAPPLSLLSHKEVTEDAVATALGFAAQVVQLLAAYMGKGLVYPVTCVGSRSLIKDGISAMVGPRMFPLFSRSVDTYRFEYGVFLLNKDIEMLMGDRDLRALDMRHTLPNLKNLLLTLTDNETSRLPSRLTVASSSVSISSLQSPILTPSTLPSETASQTQPDGLPSINTTVPVAEHDSPPASGSTTPTTSIPDTGTARKSRAFIDLAPFTGFLRSRYPSTTRPTVKSVPEASEGAQDASGSAPPTSNGEAQAESEATGDDEDDRRTIRPGLVDDEGKMEVDETVRPPAAVPAVRTHGVN
ncbi:hypothetical protein SCP_0114170 [Sparassis crispa]|uniref:Autophagy-related protein 14 n=1 Tax=Sparassis crispa TaxID=139825 RepID=A0A401G8P6_9APHY|nr:hypothetical protein SCP_0114170 [Sparassis crispa]GBE78528.1 hypothetical protein SCP_0114170 [Sparassis crispa]